MLVAALQSPDILDFRAALATCVADDEVADMINDHIYGDCGYAMVNELLGMVYTTRLSWTVQPVETGRLAR